MKSPFREAVEAKLVCQKCGAMNRPGATVIALEQHARATCGVCSHSGPVSEFLKES